MPEIIFEFDSTYGTNETVIRQIENIARGNGCYTISLETEKKGLKIKVKGTEINLTIVRDVLKKRNLPLGKSPN
jgi:hypothetical protein